MNLRRPTLNLANWNIAVDLKETKQLQQDPNAPAYNCECEACLKWQANYQDILPEQLLLQFKRTQVDLKFPTELYSFGLSHGGMDIRAVFHLNGRILIGPPPYLYGESGRLANYTIIQENPCISVHLVHTKDSTPVPSHIKQSDFANLVTIDLRLNIPN